MTRFINHIFKKYLNIDSVSSTILRKVYLNYKYKDTIDAMKDDAKMMSNSLGVQISNYISNTK